jgi:hypothetical protein
MPADVTRNGHHPALPAPPFPAVPPAIRAIPADAILRLDELRAILGVRKSTLRREVREHRLRVSRRAGCYWVLGSWVRLWIEGA